MEPTLETRREALDSGSSSGAGLRSRGAVRTRGFVPAPPTAAPEASSPQTRRAIRTRGTPVRRREEAPQWQLPEDLPRLLHTLRQQLYGFPLTLVIENCAAPPAQEFWQRLARQLEAHDAVWFLGHTPPASRGDSYLNLEDTHDRAFATVLVPDLLFVAAPRATELIARLAKWRRRARSVVFAVADASQPSWDEDVGLQDMRIPWPNVA